MVVHLYNRSEMKGASTKQILVGSALAFALRQSEIKLPPQGLLQAYPLQTPRQ